MGLPVSFSHADIPDFDIARLRLGSVDSVSSQRIAGAPSHPRLETEPRLRFFIGLNLSVFVYIFKTANGNRTTNRLKAVRTFVKTGLSSLPLLQPF